MSNLTDDHWTTLKRILRYLNETKELRILYKKVSGSLILKEWIDSSWDEDSNDSKSTHVHLMFIKGLISWKSSKQISVALFSIEAEYMGQALAAINVMWARGILKEMNIESTVLSHQKMKGKKVENFIIIYADN